MMTNDGYGKEIGNMLEGVLSPVVAHIVEDGIITTSELNMVISLLRNMGIEITPQIQGLVQQYLENALAEWRIERDALEKEALEKEEREQEQQEEIEQTQWRERIRQESQSKEVSRIIAGIAGIIGVATTVDSLDNISPSPSILQTTKSDIDLPGR